ncbi:STAS domain-containing protein [Aneurinibacillus sp. REN35]|uniref:STAS domain-containing protein n=1 Tax=Aneurinibacillus sp. REN35 TaxID=3237286 RepID=UPI0035279011
MDENSSTPHLPITTMVNGSEFIWDREQGRFQFEGDDVVLFWVTSAFRTFFEAIEEVSGTEAYEVVLETAGYRTGKIVSDFYLSKGGADTILATLPHIYSNAGWGRTYIDDYSFEEKRARIRIQNSWERKILQAQQKDGAGSFIPGHWAGVFTGLFGESMWYKVTNSPTKEADEIEIEFSSSDITPATNIHELTRQKEQIEIRKLEGLVQERTKKLTRLIGELSSPIIPVMDHILVIPLIGAFDDRRAQELMFKALNGVTLHAAKFLLLDVTGLTEIDAYTLAMLDKLTHAVRLTGSTSILVGVSPELGIQLVESNFNIEEIKCFSDLRHGVFHALSMEGMYLAKKEAKS